MQKLYCYVDETGQDTKGKFFLVSVIIIEKSVRDEVNARLIEIEKKSGKGKTKWHSASANRRIAYLHGIDTISALRQNIFYSVYETSDDYLLFTTYTIAKTITSKSLDSYHAIVLIDGLNERECERVMKGLRQLRVNCKKVRGIRDESDPLVRLADAIAGFLRDYTEEQLYTHELFAKLATKLVRLD